ncbi:cyclin-T1-3-like [Cornus florida]|uniref:cyclin-T1-3-like n=1 Tax=Cornus florida TaxID=4283 RepID=UPI0028990429|nr:cyclin-T1-3-like [Cornus florida]
MAGKLPGDPSQHGIERKATTMCIPDEYFQSLTRKWYLGRKEIEDHSPSRKDGIDHETESRLRKLYCSFLQDLGMELKVPQVTIATAMMLCHRFYLRQSHAKNEWQTVATSCVFLACKVEETPRWLSDVVVVAYKLMYRCDPSAPRRIKQLEVYDKQKELILIGEKLLLATVAFDFNVELPYKPLVTALKRLEISHKELAKVAWNFVNDWLRTTLCLQYKPHYIAAGSLFLAAKFQKVKLPTEKGKVWWLQFDVSPKLLEEVIQQMLGWLERNRKQAPTARGRVTESKAVVGKTTSNSSQSCVINGSVAAHYSGHRATVSIGVIVESAKSKSCLNQACNDTHITEKEKLHTQTSDCSSANSAIEDGDGEPRTGISDQNSRCKIVSLQNGYSKIDVLKIRETIKRKRWDRVAKEKVSNAMVEETDETWIESELESGIEAESSNVEKKPRRF